MRKDHVRSEIKKHLDAIERLLYEYNKDAPSSQLSWSDSIMSRINLLREALKRKPQNPEPFRGYTTPQ